jgi:hypothetical protein
VWRAGVRRVREFVVDLVRIEPRALVVELVKQLSRRHPLQAKNMTIVVDATDVRAAT